ncbi:hypothetical protein BGX26_004620 [Mortierella sp. AD094]|nr:hypothetical protein BGX26_004620 [Mortierella sp. AD094]
MNATSVSTKQTSTKQTSVNLSPNIYNDITSKGFPFVPIPRIHSTKDVDIAQMVENTVVNDGIPLVIDNWHKHDTWRKKGFTISFLERKYGKEVITCRDQRKVLDVDILMQDYISTAHSPNVHSSKKQSMTDTLLYAKDLSCPPEWCKTLMEKVLPPILAYRGENDLNSLSPEHAAETLMVYVGSHGTWTPAHIDHCGTIGHNIMTWADKGSSSIWFMIAAKDRTKAEALFQSLGQEIELENYFLSVDELARADFPIYVTEQTTGDLIMIPSLGYHQVANLGKATIKVAWNRLTTTCLQAAINIVLPRYKKINNPEVYKTKTIIKNALGSWTELLRTGTDSFPVSKASFCQSFQELLSLFRTIVEEDWVDLDGLGKEKWLAVDPEVHMATFCDPEKKQDDLAATCNFCHCDIWNRHFHCRDCTSNTESYDLCTLCFALGRGCEHRATTMQFMENFSLRSLRELYSSAIQAWNQSSVLAEYGSHKTIADEWISGIIPSKNVNYSSTSLAYMRQLQLKLRSPSKTGIQQPSNTARTLPLADSAIDTPNSARSTVLFIDPADDARNRGGAGDSMTHSHVQLRTTRKRERHPDSEPRENPEFEDERAVPQEVSDARTMADQTALEHESTRVDVRNRKRERLISLEHSAHYADMTNADDNRVLRRRIEELERALAATHATVKELQKK